MNSIWWHSRKLFDQLSKSIVYKYSSRILCMKQLVKKWLQTIADENDRNSCSSESECVLRENIFYENNYGLKQIVH